MKIISKSIAALLLSALLLTAAGCNNNNGNSSSASQAPSSSAPEVSQEESMEPEVSEGEEEPVVSEWEYTAQDSQVDIRLQLEDGEFDLDTVIDAKITITNNGETDINYVVGSGSNMVPDSLKVKLGDLAAMFYPQIATMDYQITSLSPGESATYDCAFAPYIHNGGDWAFGTENDLEFFKGEDFTPAEAGTVEGTYEFTYYTATEGGENLDVANIEEGDKHTLAGDFSVNIVE